jgi:hypothetical protein
VGPTVELRWKFYKTKKEAHEGECGEDIVGWGRHLVCRPVTDARVLGTLEYCQWEERETRWHFFRVLYRLLTNNLNESVSQ